MERTALIALTENYANRRRNVNPIESNEWKTIIRTSKDNVSCQQTLKIEPTIYEEAQLIDRKGQEVKGHENCLAHEAGGDEEKIKRYGEQKEEWNEALIF